MTPPTFYFEKKKQNFGEVEGRRKGWAGGGWGRGMVRGRGGGINIRKKYPSNAGYFS